MVNLYAQHLTCTNKSIKRIKEIIYVTHPRITTQHIQKTHKQQHNKKSRKIKQTLHTSNNSIMIILYRPHLQNFYGLKNLPHHFATSIITNNLQTNKRQWSPFSRGYHHHTSATYICSKQHLIIYLTRILVNNHLQKSVSKLAVIFDTSFTSNAITTFLPQYRSHVNLSDNRRSSKQHYHKSPLIIINASIFHLLYYCRNMIITEKNITNDQTQTYIMPINIIHHTESNLRRFHQSTIERTHSSQVTIPMSLLKNIHTLRLHMMNNQVRLLIVQPTSMALCVRQYGTHPIPPYSIQWYCCIKAKMKQTSETIDSNVVNIPAELKASGTPHKTEKQLTQTIALSKTVLRHTFTNKTRLRQRYGGGKMMSNPDDDVITVSSTEHLDAVTEDGWTTFIHNMSLQFCTNIINRSHEHLWSPNHNLVFQHQTHQLLQTFTFTEINRLRNICQATPNKAIIRHTHDHRIYISIKDIQNLITHGQVTSDHTMLIYLKLLSDTYEIPYLYTDFIPRLQHEGWNTVRRYFSNPSRRSRKRSLTRPDISDEPAIIIPAHIQDSHWLALVRREINNQVIFLYSDDMNCSRTEQDIKQLIITQTDNKFCPSNAQWINCKGTFYTPHSNECGPRTLLALHIMATHPNPNSNILTHLMHPNLAQISRVWIAVSLVTGKLHDNNILYPNTTNTNSFSRSASSTPSDIIPWSTPNNQNHEITTLSHQVSQSNTSSVSKTSQHTITATSIPADDDEFSLTPNNMNITIPSISTRTMVPQQGHHNQKQTTLQPNSSDHERSTLQTPIQQDIRKWTINQSSINTPSEDTFLQPYGHDLQQIDSTKTFRIIMQNPQFALQITKGNHEHIQLIKHLSDLQVSSFAAISPNVNFCNMSNIAKFKYPFRQIFQQVHVSASSSDFGRLPLYTKRETLTGGNAILSFDHWASKVCSTQHDPRGQGTFTITTYQGKNGKKLSLIAAYIAVQKGTNHGETSLFAQQTTLMELNTKRSNKPMNSTFCPRKAAIKALSDVLTSLQEQNHAIILMVDANQTHQECYTNKGIKPHSIEWLRIEHGLDDPFVTHFGQRPPTTTINNNRDIDYIYTWGVQIDRISTMAVNIPANSDHLGICADINIASLFGGTYGALSSLPRRKLTLKNVRAKLNYISYITKQWKERHYFMRAQTLYDAMINGTFNTTHYAALQILDKEITQTLLKGEEQCAKNDKQRDPWSPKLCAAGVNLSYWKRKHKMSQRQHFRWHILDSLVTRTNISATEHSNINPESIKNNFRQARRTWRETKKQGNELRQTFLKERAEDYASKRNITSTQALKAIRRAEQSLQEYSKIQELLGGKKTKNPLTQIEVLYPDNTAGEKTTLTEKTEIERAIMARNQRHSRQSLHTPFSTIPELHDAIDPDNPLNKIESILKGDFTHNIPDDVPLSQAERQWISELQQRIDEEIDTHVSTNDFINFFKPRKEKTASSHSGRHYGHYKVLAQMADEGHTEIVDTLIMIMNISLATSHPLERWLHSAQVMIEKGKGNYIENLRIIQLCEADLNFILNILWGNRMIHAALKHNALNDSQFALPGNTCHSAVWNKVLYCDLLRQTLQPGIMTDYDATAAFDRVLHTMSIVTCRRFGMPQSACLFLYNLLHNMEFHVITGLGHSQTSFTNNEDISTPGQGVLQGSSSAAPIYNVNSDVSLATYQKLSTGAIFTHPITKQNIQDHATQYVDDKTDMVNLQGAINEPLTNSDNHETLFESANRNSNLWAELQWISGGDLNSSKCFSYFIDPHYDYKTESIKYSSKYKAPGNIVMTNPATKTHTPITREEPYTARRTLGVHLAPTGNSNAQTKICIEKAETFLGKLKHSNLNQQTKWKAISTVLSPGVLYPLISSMCTKAELDKIEQVMARAKCNALGLNEHFPRALLYGPHNFGGMQLPTANAHTAIERINYFLFHIRKSTKIGQKLEISLALLQLETGLTRPFLSSTYETYGSLATTSLIKCIWAQTEPYGLVLQPNLDYYWIPKLQGTNDISIMDDARVFFDDDDWIKINRCRLYYQVITLYDLLTYDCSQVHPEFTSGHRLQSRKSMIMWVNFNKPSKKHFNVWNRYIKQYVQPRLNNLTFNWYKKVQPHYNSTYFLSTRTGKLYYKSPQNTFYMHDATKHQPGGRTTIFKETCSETLISDDILQDLHPMDVYNCKQRIKILCTSNINQHGQQSETSTASKYSWYRKLPKSLRRICGKISTPPDGGIKLMNYLRDRDASLLGVSDSSIVDGTGTHAWILTTGEKEHISDSCMKIEGSGPVNGDKETMSSARGEMQGQTALAIISEAFLTEHDAKDMPITFFTDNQGVQQTCQHPKLHRIGHHKKANIDLQMEHVQVSQRMNFTHEWVRGHQDNDMEWNTIEELNELNLSAVATLNIYCDRKASEARQYHTSDQDAEVLPAEKWALYSTQPTRHKITGKLSEGILRTLNRENIEDYIAKKHNLTADKLHHVDDTGLQRYLKSLRPHNRASTVKLIHRWIPTNEFLFKQKRADSPICPRCQIHNETASHILTCTNNEAADQRRKALYTCLENIARENTSSQILTCLEISLSDLLQIPSECKYKSTDSASEINTSLITDAQHHQSIIGWENAIRGYTSSFWLKAHLATRINNGTNKRKAPWNRILVQSLINLHRQIWHDRNVSINGTTIQEKQAKLRQKVTEKVTSIYNKNYKLAPRYQAIKAVKMEDRLRRSTRNLQDWIARVEHQINMTEYINNCPVNQMTIIEAFNRVKQSKESACKYPP